jgi:hypothetical protein
MNPDQEQPGIVETHAEHAAAGVVQDGRFCIRCGYVLKGLPRDGVCPECGTSVALSLREPLLANADPEYLRKTKRGLSFVLNGILLMIVLSLAPVAMFALAATGVPGRFGMALIEVGNTCVTILILMGYWLYTAPDPGQVALEATNGARKAVRVSVAIQAGITVAILTLRSIVPMSLSLSQQEGNALYGITLGLTLINGICWIVQFVSVMRYTRWLAGRVPDMLVIKRVKRNMWLLPVLYIVGLVLLGLGPLIALILYWNLLDRMRKHLKSIIATGRPAVLKGK